MKTCNCVVGCKHLDHTDCGVDFCPLHAAAPAMYEWLKDYVSRASDSNPLKRSALDILKEIDG